METDKLRQIIADKNERREHDTLRTAEQIIEAIVREQANVVACQERITEFRKELAQLEVVQLDPSTVLGD